MNFELIVDKFLGSQAVSSFVLIVAAVLVQIMAARFLKSRKSIDVDQRRRFISNIKNGLVVLVAIGLFLVWAPSLRTFALSLTAFAVAFIIATKEVILCISGSLVKATTGSMSVGDWIEVNGVRGEVIDQDLMSTNLQELGAGSHAFEFTGKTVVIPNSVFLSAAVKNEQFYKSYMVQESSFIVDASVDPEPIISGVISVIKAEMAGVEEVTRKYLALIESRAGIALPYLELGTRLAMTNEGRVKITVSCFLPIHSAAEINRKAMEAGLTILRKNLEFMALSGQKLKSREE